MDFMNNLLAGPVLPATILVGAMVCWSLLGLLGAIDLDLPTGDVDLDMDVDVDMDVNVTAGGGDVASQGLGLLLIRWLNIHEVPLMIWVGVFSITWWTLSISSWLAIDSRFISEPGWMWSLILIGKNLFLAVPLTKFITSPMRAWFRVEKISAGSLVGQECQISSLEASPDFGQVKFKTDGAPLLLNVRTDGPHLARGAQVWITHYDAKRRVYIVSPTGTESE